MKILSRAEFAAKRRGDQTSMEERLQPYVAEAVKRGVGTENWDEDLIAKVVDEYVKVFHDEGGVGNPHPADFAKQISDTLALTKGDDAATVDRISLWLATAILNGATVEAGLSDPAPLVFEWVTMHDDAVRETHRAVDGQQQFEGEKFTVGGEQLEYPGQPVGDPSIWINCRCALAPVLAEQAEFRSEPTRGGVVTATTEEPQVEEIESDDREQTDPEQIAVTWHGVLAPEGVWSGDGRMFAPDSLTNRDLPLPLTWQKSSSEGHSGSVTVGRIDTLERVDGMMQATGVFLTTPEADEVVGLLADFGKFGVSVDADDAEMNMDEETGALTFTKARIASAAIVAIPAFAEAYIALGEAPEQSLVAATVSDKPWSDFTQADYSDEQWYKACTLHKNGDSKAKGDNGLPILEPSGTLNRNGVHAAAARFNQVEAPAEAKASAKKALRGAYTRLGEDVPDALKAAASTVEFKDLAPGITEDGPGWLTHPVDTDRLRDYWAYGEGAAKIAWGTPGDFDRCRVNLAKYVKPQYLNGYCANRHYDATGFWPGRAPSEQLAGTPGPALSLVAASIPTAPSAWFADPKFTVDDGRMVQDIDGSWGCPMRITDEGQMFGHLAKWDACHTGFSGVCTVAPHSATNYAYFLTGEVLTDAGPVPVGGITLGGGHADGRVGLRPAAAHYDSTSSVVADVTVGEDEFGIWYAGQIRPGTTEQQIYDLRAAGVLSGDWREFRGEVTELVAALAVNSPGFQTPRIGVSDGVQISLVAAGVVHQGAAAETTPFNIEVFADAVAAAIDNREKRRLAMRSLNDRVAAPHKQKMAALAARVKGD